MRTCVIIPVSAEGTAGFMWQWRALEGNATSKFCFEYFYPCLEDARRNGYAVDMQATLQRSRNPEQVAPEEYKAAALPA